MAGSVSDAVGAVERTQDRFTRLLRSGLDGTRQVKGLSWTIRDLAAHLATTGLAYRSMAEGEASPFLDLNRRGETSQELLEAEDEQDLSALADRPASEVARMVTALRSRNDDDVVL